MLSPVLQYPQVNGAKVSFCSMEFKLENGFSFTGIKAIDYKDGHEFGKVWGNHSTLQGTTRGRVECTGSIEMYRDQSDALLDFLAETGQGGYSEKRYTFTVGYAELGATLTTSDVLPAVRFHSMETSSSEGVEAVTVKLQMHMIGQILWHGRTTPKTALSMFPVITG
jgi:hypothetical protein